MSSGWKMQRTLGKRQTRTDRLHAIYDIIQRVPTFPARITLFIMQENILQRFLFTPAHRSTGHQFMEPNVIRRYSIPTVPVGRNQLQCPSEAEHVPSSVGYCLAQHNAGHIITRLPHTLFARDSRNTSRKASTPQEANISTGRHPKYPKLSNNLLRAISSRALDRCSSTVTVQSADDHSNAHANSTARTPEEPLKLHPSKRLSPEAEKKIGDNISLLHRVLEAEKISKEKRQRRADIRFRGLLAKWRSFARIKAMEEQLVDSGANEDEIVEVKMKFTFDDEAVARSVKTEGGGTPLESQAECRKESEEKLQFNAAQGGMREQKRVQFICMDRTRAFLHGIHSDRRRGLAVLGM